MYLIGVVIVEGEGAVLRVNLECPVVSNAEVRERIELLFRVVSGVGNGMGVLEGSTFPKRKGVWDFVLSPGS